MPDLGSSRRRASDRELWLGYLRRHLLEHGELERLADAGEIAGVLVDPNGLAGLVARGGEYRRAIRERARRGADPRAIEEAVRLADERAAADALARRYHESMGEQGLVAIELSFVGDEDETASLQTIQRHAATIRRPNVVYRVPSNAGGLKLVETLAAAGFGAQAIHVHSEEQLTAVARAWLQGLWRRQRLGQSLDDSRLFFDCPVADLDAHVDERLRGLTTGGQVDPDVADALRGKTGLAVGTLMIERRRELLAERSWGELEGAGARVPRICWSGLDRVADGLSGSLARALVGGDRIGVVSLGVLYALRRDAATAGAAPDHHVEEARQVVADLEAAGVDVAAVAEDARDRAVASGIAAHARLRAAFRERCEREGRTAAIVRAGVLREPHEAAVRELRERDAVRRLWARDASLWQSREVEAASVVHRLGWMGAGHAFAGAAGRLGATAAAPPESVLLIGMGGSSLGADSCARALELDRLHVLDTTVADRVRQILAGLDLQRTGVIVSSKSGTTVETTALEVLVRAHVALGSERPGAAFTAVTDPGTPLHELAVRESYRDVCLNPPDIGGRFSVLSYFGLVPLSATAADVEELLGRARTMELRCAPEVPVGEHPGVQLAALLAAGHAAARDKLTLWTSPRLGALADWIEQLVAESTGKDGRGIVPITDEPPRDADDYADDRLFVLVQLGDDPLDPSIESLASELADRGHPVVHWTLDDGYEVGAEIVRWQIATALLGVLIGVNPFDEPDVDDAKRRTAHMLRAYERDGVLPEPDPVAIEGLLAVYADPQRDPDLAAALDSRGEAEEDRWSVASWLDAHLGRAKPSDYVCLQAFLAASGSVAEAVDRLRATVARSTGLATAVGWGPRFLHSTGQLHKGGRDCGVYLQLTADTAEDLRVPGMDHGLATLCRAQALGDFQALQERGRRVMRVHLRGAVEDALTALVARIAEARV